MEKLVSLFLGVVTKPKETFEEIKKSIPLKEGFVISIFLLNISFLILYFDPRTKPIFNATTLCYLAVNYFVSTLVILPAILNFLARSEKLDSTYKKALLIFLFAGSPYIALFPLQIFFSITKITILYNLMINKLFGYLKHCVLEERRCWESNPGTETAWISNPLLYHWATTAISKCGFGGF